MNSKENNLDLTPESFPEEEQPLSAMPCVHSHNKSTTSTAVIVKHFLNKLDNNNQNFILGYN